MSSPPVTGNDDLDAYLFNLQLGVDTVASAVSTSIPTGEVTSNYYSRQYLQVRYANSETGKDISTSPTNRKYYGVYNSITTAPSSNPADYTWFELTDTFGTDKFLFYTVTFGRNINLFIGSTAPSVDWQLVPTTYINLDVITSGFVDNESFETDFEPIKIVTSLPDPSTYSGPSIIYVSTTNKLYRLFSGQWTSNVLASDIDGTLALNNFANDLRPVEVVSSLPTTGNFVGRTAVLTTDSKLYRYTSTGWSAAVPTTDLTGQVTSTQITNNAITSDKISANAVIAGKIATDAVTAGTIAAGAISSDKLSANSVIAGKIAAGAVTADKLSVTNLSSINSNLGTITGGSLNINNSFIVDSNGATTINNGSLNINNKFIVSSAGATTIQSGTTGERTVITERAIKVFDSSGTLRVQIGDLTA